MERVPRHELRITNTHLDEYELILYLDDQLTEFADELGREPRARKDIITTARQILSTQYPHVKVTVVKVLLGGMVISSLQLGASTTSSAHAEEPTKQTIQTTKTISYHVIPGDNLWSISRKFNTSVEQIKLSNNLTTDLLAVGQTLVIPTSGQSNFSTPSPDTTVKETSHTVVAGETLWSIANRYGTTVDSLKKTNHLKGDSLQIGQTLSLTANEENKTNPVFPAPTTKQTVTSHTVGVGETLYGIATRYDITVNHLKKANNLASDILQIGQKLTIPTDQTNTVHPTPPTTNERVTSHMVEAGETLWGIASRYRLTVDQLQGTNGLKTPTLQIGQILTIPPVSTGSPQPTEKPIVEEKRDTFIYSIVTGDSLSALANRFGVTVDAIRAANNLKSDSLQVGQALTIPNGLGHESVNTISYKSHTIVSGDNIWDLSVRYGIPQGELLRANNLTTSSSLSIGQKLQIPVHNIAVKQVVNERQGEYLDWWTEAQYVFTIGKTAKVTDLMTGKSFYIKRTIGANHADSETVAVNDTTIAKSIWGGFSWTPRAVILEVDGRKIAASMSFMPHEREYIMNNGITGHFDVYFGNST